MTPTLTTFLWAVACVGASASREEVPPEMVVQAPPLAPRAADAVSSSAVPPEFERVAMALSAYHAEDLPTRATLDALPNAEDALRWLALHGRTDGVRARALVALAEYPSSENLGFVDTVLAGQSTPLYLHAACFEALARWPVSERSGRVDAIRAALGSSSPSVVVAAARAARGIDSLREVVLDVGRSHPSASVREQIHMMETHVPVGVMAPVEPQ